LVVILSFLKRASVLERIDRWASNRVNTPKGAHAVSLAIIAGLWISALAWFCGVL
jgi:hypothetical protein